MKDKITIIFVTYMVVWVCFCIAVSVGLYITKDINCLWFLIIPSLLSINIKSDKKNEVI